MSRSRRMLEAQKKRERDELPLEAMDGGLRHSNSTSPVNSRRVKRERSASSGRSTSPPALCIDSSTTTRHWPRVPVPATSSAKRSASQEDESASSQSFLSSSAATSTVRYPVSRLQVALKERRVEPGKPTEAYSHAHHSPTSSPPLVPAVTHSAAKPSPAAAMNTDTADVVDHSGPSPSSPSGGTQRPSFRAVVSPGMVPQHLSRTASQQSTPMLSQPPPPTWTFPAADARAGTDLADATSRVAPDDEPWGPLPPSVQPHHHHGSARQAVGSVTPPSVGYHADEQPALPTAAHPATDFPSAPTSPLAPTAAAAPAPLDGAGLATEPPLSPETVRLKQEWQEPNTLSSSASESDDEPHLDDYSGFENRGNDCYACSVLTLLLRNELFRDRLLYSPLLLAWRLYHGEPLRPNYLESGYRTRWLGKSKKDPQQVAREERAVLDAFEARYGYRLTEDDADLLIEADAENDGEEGSADGVSTPHSVHTVHSVLADLVRRQQKREIVVNRVNDPNIRLALRRVCLEKMLGGGSSSHGRDREPPYFRGVGMSALASFFNGEFFTGYQEDAHEFVVALFNKLEEEAVAFEKKRQLIDRVRHDIRRDAEVGRRRAEGTAGEREASQASLPESAEAPSAETGEEREMKAQTETVEAAALASGAWVNRLLQGRLLSIIRCRHPGCAHEIVTEEPFMNLTLPVALPTPAVTGTSAPTAGVAPTGCHSAHDVDVDDEPSRSRSHESRSGEAMNEATVAAGEKAPLNTHAQAAHSEDSVTPPLLTAHTPPPSALARNVVPVPSVASLLQHTMQYDSLDGYACDACRSSSEQWQGGCFIGSPPELMLVQMKRFAVTVADGEVIVSKEGCPVKVDTELVVHSLIDDRRPDGLDEQAASDDTLYDASNKCFTDALRELERRAAASDTGEEPQIRALRAEYRLQGLVLHLGGTLHFGHYVAEFATDAVPAQNEGGEAKAHTEELPHGDRAQRTPDADQRLVWRLANDCRVSLLDATEFSSGLAESRTCYLLLYQKVSEAPVMCPLSAVMPRQA